MKALYTFIFVCCSIVGFSQFQGEIQTEVINSGSKMTTTWFIGEDAIKLQMSYQSADGPVKVDFIAKKGTDKLTVITDSKSYKGYSEIGDSAITSQYELDKIGFTSNGGPTQGGGKFQGYSKKHQLAVWTDSSDISLKPFDA